MCVTIPLPPLRPRRAFAPACVAGQSASPGTAAWSGSSNTVSRALRLISESGLEDGGVEVLAERLGVGSRHLRRLFLQHLGATPSAVAQTRRMHFAKKLIDETRSAHESDCHFFGLWLRSPIQRCHFQGLSADAYSNQVPCPSENHPTRKSIPLSTSLPATLQMERHVGISAGARHSRRRIGGRWHVSPFHLRKWQPGTFCGLA